MTRSGVSIDNLFLLFLMRFWDSNPFSSLSTYCGVLSAESDEAVCRRVYVTRHLFQWLSSKEKSAKGKQQNAEVTIVTSLDDAGEAARS